MACVCCPHRLCLSCLVIRMCHHPGSLAHDIVWLVLVWGACFCLALCVTWLSTGHFLCLVSACVSLRGSPCLLQHVPTVTGTTRTACARSVSLACVLPATDLYSGDHVTQMYPCPVNAALKWFP